MALIVEDGSGKSDAESYVSVSACNTYAVALGLSFPTGDQAACEAALRRATAWIDGKFGDAFVGIRKNGRLQALAWPRAGASDADRWPISPDTVPIEIIHATSQAAVRELATPNSLAPDLDRGGGLKSVKAGSVQIEYGANAPANQTFQAIELGLRTLLTVTAAAYGAASIGRAVRG
jgi:hypothetical protein